MVCTRTDERSYRAFRRAAQAANMKFTEWVRERLRQAAARELG